MWHQELAQEQADISRIPWENHSEVCGLGSYILRLTFLGWVVIPQFEVEKLVENIHKCSEQSAALQCRIISNQPDDKHAC